MVSSIQRIIFSSLVLSLIFIGCLPSKEKDIFAMKPISSPNDAIALFPKTVAEINEKTKNSIEKAQKQLEKIISIDCKDRTFENTALAFDSTSTTFSIQLAPIETILYTHPDKVMRDVAQESIIKLQEFSIDHFANNVALYNAFSSYVEGNAKKEILDEEYSYFLKETMKGFKRAGLNLPKETREEIAKLRKKLSKISLQFDTNINTDATFIAVPLKDLSGVDTDFLNSLEKDDKGNFILKGDYPTHAKIMRHCSIEKTRKQFFKLFNNRAYKANIALLHQVIALRDQLARLLGYSSYAHLDIDEQMAKTPERAREFIDDLIAKSSKKQKQEFDLLLSNLPVGISLTNDNKIKPWDILFIKEKYKQKYLKLDDQIVSEYFPMEKTVEGLLKIYQQFFDLTFKKVATSNLWHEDVSLIEIYNKSGQLHGYLFLDLYPRANKYTHACQITIVPATKNEQNIINHPGVCVVLANFPRSTPTKPSLLRHDDVTTFFHEFGHAMHSLLGATKLKSFSGTNVKSDFVEMPSQMLEEWMYDKEILKNISSHYKTGESLSDSIIEQLNKVKKFDSGTFLTRQAMLSLVSLEYFKVGEKKNIEEIWWNLYTQTTPFIDAYYETHPFASFGHLMSYGAKYYGYMWSKVFALDLFDYIKKYGLTNPVIGNRYKNEVLGKGGSIEPDTLLVNFLGRKPNDEAFIKNLGLNESES